MSDKLETVRRAGGIVDRQSELGATTQLANWLERHRNGDASAQTEIIAHVCDRLRILASKMLRADFSRLARWEQTDDVLQMALMKLHRSLNEVRPESVAQFMGLSATQIRRALLDLARHHFGKEGPARHHYSDGHLTDVPRKIDEQPNSDGPESLEDWAAFHEAVENLPAEEKQVFSLVWYDGLTQIEAAELLGVNERTIRRRWLSARTLVHETLGQSTE